MSNRHQKVSAISQMTFMVYIFGYKRCWCIAKIMVRGRQNAWFNQHKLNSGIPKTQQSLQSNQKIVVFLMIMFSHEDSTSL